MKRISFLLLLAASLLITGCSKSEIIDWYPINLMITVIDYQNNYLSTPEHRQLLEGTTIEYNGNVIPLDLNSYPETKDLPPRYEDRFFIGESYPFGNCLVFGELYGGSEYNDISFKITWPDGTKDIITYTRKLNYSKISAKEIWKINGEICNNPVIIRKDFRK